MEIKEAVRAAFKELITPELDKIKKNKDIKATLGLANKRSSWRGEKRTER